MILKVKHTTTYRYETPVRGAVQSLRLFPSVFEGQSIVDWRVEVTGGTRGGRFRDGAGDEVEGWSVRGPATEIRVEVEGQVATTDLSGLLRGHKEIVSPQVFMHKTAPILVDEALRTLAEEASGNAENPLDAAHRLSAAVADAIAYRPGTTHAHTTAAEALAQGEGVCQDHAHALIAAAHARGMPARYVSGYLQASQDGTTHEAAHAWAEIWVDDLGWVGFDPANRCCPDERYVRLGSGFDAVDAAPIRGIAQGHGAESLDVTVAVQAVQQ